MIRVANAPCSWGVLEFESSATTAPASQVLDEMAAAGYAEFDPVGPNDTPEQRALNRRTEIVLEPNLSDLPSLDGLNDKK